MSEQTVWICRLVTAALLSCSGIFSLTRQLHMLQQNSYFPSRYAKWLWNSFAYWLAGQSVLYCAISLMQYRKFTVVSAAVLSAALCVCRAALCIRRQKKAVKPLVYTGRIKRLYGAAALIFAVLILLFVWLRGVWGFVFFNLCLMLAAITPLLALLCWAVTYPVEKAVARWYIRDAQRILASCRELRVIGITGSYGKTTTKFILTRILSEKFNVLCTPQSFNTPMGIVRTVREKLTAPTQVFVCEMGAKNIGDIREICDIVHPDIGIITSVGEQHLETFGNVDNVYRTKFELAAAVEQKGGEVYVNADSPAIAERYAGNAKTYGTQKDLDFFAQNIRYSPAGAAFDLCLRGERVSVSTKLLGRHSVADITAAAAVAYDLGVSAEEIRSAVAALRPTEHRLELKPFLNGSLMIDDAYNSNPEGCLEAVRVLGSFEGMKKIIVTPGLIELGEREYECNFALGVEAAKVCDQIILVGKNRSKPMRKAALREGFPEDRLTVVSSFREALGVLGGMADGKTVTLIENDLPDNYLN